MKMLLQDNAWSCVPTAFAMVLDILPKDIYNLLDHDGSEILYPELRDPYARRGFHVQEMIVCCLKLGVFPVALDREVELIPPMDVNDVSLSDAVHTPRILSFDAHLEHYLGLRSGVLIGWINHHHHAVAWCHKEQRIFDPTGLKRNLNELSIETFWACF